MTTHETPAVKIRKGLPTKKSLRELFDYCKVNTPVSFLYLFDRLDVAWSGAKYEDQIKQMIPVIESYGFEVTFSPYQRERLRRGYLTIRIKPEIAKTT